MAEAFSNKVVRAAGIVTSYSGSTIGAGGTTITVTAITGIGVSFLVDNQNFVAGTRVHSTLPVSGGVGTVFTDKNSTNTASASSQIVKFLGPTTAYTSPAATKSIIIGGTFANNTNNSVNLTVEVYDTTVGVTSTGSAAIASKIPVPSGSSFVISDTGKTLLEAGDELKVYCDTTDAVDVSLSILTGVN
tara:strand:+ start:267 stop:833 length:567 start_codon:yes stop_codon:yes gene_type:complete